MNGALPSALTMEDFEPDNVRKRDVFSETIMGHARADANLKLALRNLSDVPWYGRFLSQWLARREARALRAVQGIAGTPHFLVPTATAFYGSGAKVHLSIWPAHQKPLFTKTPGAYYVQYGGVGLPITIWQNPRIG